MSVALIVVEQTLCPRPLADLSVGGKGAVWSVASYGFTINGIGNGTKQTRMDRVVTPLKVFTCFRQLKKFVSIVFHYFPLDTVDPHKLHGRYAAVTP